MVSPHFSSGTAPLGVLSIDDMLVEEVSSSIQIVFWKKLPKDLHLVWNCQDPHREPK